jgi:16S rRNA G1207 methylase RsmC
MMNLYKTTGLLADIHITAKGIEVVDVGCGCCADASIYSRKDVILMIDEEIAALQAARAALLQEKE